MVKIRMLKPRLGITLTESPLIRSWLLCDNAKLFMELKKEFEIFIFCKEEQSHFIQRFLEKFMPESDPVQVKIIGKLKESKIMSLIGFILRYSEKSQGNKRLRYLLFERGKISIYGLLGRNLIWLLFSHWRLGYTILRFLYKSLPSGKYRILLKEIKLDKLLVTSLTNFDYDVELLRVAKKLGITTIGTPRSWDNLVSHGLLRVLPDLFLSHSQYMSECAYQYQDIERNSIIETGTSTYRTFLIPNSKKSKSDKVVVIGCVGPNSNPSEADFIEKFIRIASNNFPNLKLRIIQHPKFRHSKSFKYSNTEEIFFDFLKTDSLQEYYNSLQQCDLLLTGGSTIGLDALFVGTPVECFFIDLVKTGYWESSMRYLTHRTHYKDFINILNIKTHLTIESVLISLGSISIGNTLEVRKPDFFTGHPNFDFNLEIIKSLRVKL